MLSAVLGSVAAALAVLALDGVDAVVLVTVVLLVVVVLGVAVAGLRTGSVADPAPGRPTCVSSRGLEQKEHRNLSSLSIGSAHAF